MKYVHFWRDNSEKCITCFCAICLELLHLKTRDIHYQHFVFYRKAFLSLVQGVECNVPLWRILKAKYSQCYSHRHHYMVSPLLQAGGGEILSYLPQFIAFLWEVVVPPSKAKPHHWLPFLSPHPPFLVQFISCSQTFVANACPLLCPVNSVTMGTVPDPAGSPYALLIKLQLSPQLDF